MQTRPQTSSSAGARLQAGTKVKATAIRTASPESRAWKGAVLQTAREGRATDLVALLADLEDCGDITREPQETELNPADLGGSDMLDAEMDLSDEDDLRPTDWDSEMENVRDAAFAPAKGPNTVDESAELPSKKIELLVADDCCRVHRPGWMRAESLTDTGQEFLDEISRRFNLLDAVGAWLSKNRKEFLRTPDPWLLGVEALDEMRRGLASVSPGAFLVLTGFAKIVSPDLLSRYATDCFIVWNDGTLPLNFVFGAQARIAWSANAVVQFAAHQGSAVTEAVLDRFQSITVPRNTEEKQRLWSKEVDQLDFGEFIAKANLIADTKWTDVLSVYRTKLLQGLS
jgi:hypothetical protein